MSAISEYVQISRDPFSRETLVRVATQDTGTGCAWCGGTRYRDGKPTDRLFRYGVERDAICSRVAWDKAAFCSISCRTSYHT